MTVIMRDAIKPNLLQTLENTPVLVHAGPFGNIAHGNSSVVADLIGIHTGDFLITEAGFGAGHGGGAVLQHQVPGLRAGPRRRRRGHHRAGAQGALRAVTGSPRASRCPPRCSRRTLTRCSPGAANLRKHIENVRLHGVTPVVAINAMPGDFASEHEAIREVARVDGRRARRSAPTSPTAAAARRNSPRRSRRRPTSRASSTSSTRRRRPLREKIETVATQVYGADGVDYTAAAARQLDTLREGRFRRLPGLHRQDPPVPVGRPGAEGGTDRVAAAGAGGPGVGRGRLRLPDLRRHAHHAGAGARTPPPSGSTSTPTARSSACRDRVRWNTSSSRTMKGSPERAAR